MANFLLNFPFYLIVPILPLYMIDVISADNATIGVVLSCFMLSALVVRPFSGFILDLTARKPLYIASYLCIIGVYCGYMYAATIAGLVAVRLVHGFLLGAATTASNTLVIDIMPSERRGEGLGYFGMMGNLSMALGPMAGMFLYARYAHDYNVIFGAAIASCAAGCAVAAFIRAPAKPRMLSAPVSLDRFILLKGLPAGASLLLMALPYAMMTGFVTLFTQDLGIPDGAAYFFLCFSAGIIVSRAFSGRQIDRGRLTDMIAIGTAVGVIAYFMMGMSAHAALSGAAMRIYFYAAAAMLGIGFGMIFPAYNTLFVNLARNNQRGTASSTYMTAWDIGIGSGLLLGGYLSGVIGLGHVYLIGSASCVCSLMVFVLYAAPHFKKHRLR